MTSHIPSLTLPAFIFDSPAASILLPISIGTAIGYSTRPQDTKKKYLSLRQPPLNPPPWVFGPVWTALYATMGYAAYRAWSTGANSFNPATRDWALHGATLYTLQLGLNFAWMPLFFVAERPIEATIDVVALGGTTAYLAYVWSHVDGVAAWMLAPYLAWIGFATYLCAGCGYLNGWDFSKKSRAKNA
ncbi:TspO/MBR-related protein [Trichodelitschia bisporula]|uniref:TspO/MBR-related protein n=1 Tax=Trichodelitschia bisporula TaxID=703511 RepID=A0A6G1I6Q8_9PEZI|nr:TspO/MBR-related protein [Trichodelitschia bisporula]